eukprot:13587-Eustigmatos_ZCMA.PRE.1
MDSSTVRHIKAFRPTSFSFIVLMNHGHFALAASLFPSMCKPIRGQRFTEEMLRPDAQNLTWSSTVTLLPDVKHRRD